MAGVEALAILAAMPDLIKAVIGSYRKTADMVEHYRHRGTLVSYFKTEVDFEQSRILAGWATLGMIMGHWREESTYESRSDGNLVNWRLISDPNHTDKAMMSQSSKKDGGGNPVDDNLASFFSHIVGQLKASQDKLKTMSEQLDAYQTRFNSASHRWLKKFFIGAKFVIEGHDTLANSLIMLHDLSKDWMTDTMFLTQGLSLSVLLRIDSRDRNVFRSDQAALLTVLEMRKRVEGGPDQTLARCIDINLMGSYKDYQPLQNEDAEEFGIRRPGGADLSPEFAGSVVDCRQLRWRDLEDIRKDTESIARLLCGDVGVDPITFEAGTGGFLKCQGYVERTGEAQRFELVFQIPNGYSSDPRTLRSMLIDENRPSLKHRYKLSLKLAGTLFILQTSGFVHKRVRPDSILMIKPTFWENHNVELGEPFLLGWGDARSEDGVTKKIPLHMKTQSTSYNLTYTHPRDAGMQRTDEYRSLDDVYSFGVTLIEIALWKSFFIWDEGEKRYMNNSSKVNLVVGPKNNILLKDIYDNFIKMA